MTQKKDALPEALEALEEGGSVLPQLPPSPEGLLGAVEFDLEGSKGYPYCYPVTGVSGMGVADLLYSDKVKLSKYTRRRLRDKLAREVKLRDSKPKPHYQTRRKEWRAKYRRKLRKAAYWNAKYRSTPEGRYVELKKYTRKRGIKLDISKETFVGIVEEVLASNQLLMVDLKIVQKDSSLRCFSLENLLILNTEGKILYTGP